jgi:signal peptidase I
MYLNKYSFDAIEMLLLTATVLLGAIALVDDLWIEPRRRLEAAKPVHTSVGMRVVQVAFLVLMVRLAVNMVRSGALDFSFVLVAGAAFCGAIWLLDKFILTPARLVLARQHGKPDADAAVVPTTTEYAISFFPVIAVVLIIRSFLIEPFRIPSDSMMPTLLDGDFIFVNKYTYGLRLPVANTKIVDIGEPKRGDVIVFRLPTDPSTNYIKRLIGLPGDHVEVQDNQVIINGTPMKLTWDGFYADSPNYIGARLGSEDLGTIKHVVMLAKRFGSDYSGTDFDAIVPPGHYFFMGDNRNNSQDSRFPQVGFVPEENIVGRAVRIWMHWEWPKMPAWSRIGQAIE